MNKNRVETICGKYPEGFIKEDISSNPDFVFINDPNFPGINVFDEEGNTITVNSFQECEHYVMGGWDSTPGAILEYELQIYLILILGTFLLGKTIYMKIKKL